MTNIKMNYHPSSNEDDKTQENFILNHDIKFEITHKKLAFIEDGMCFILII